MFKLVFASFLLAVIFVAASGFLPMDRSWQNPPHSADMPSGGTFYGLPFPYKSIVCCGIAGNATTNFSFIILLADFVIIFIIIFLILFLLRKLIFKKKDVQTDRT